MRNNLSDTSITSFLHTKKQNNQIEVYYLIVLLFYYSLAILLPARPLPNNQ